jgi:Glycosyltransferase Family 4
MPRVLIVTSSYAPTMVADMQRARQLAWELPTLGWEVTVLSPSTQYQTPSCIDEDSTDFFPPNCHVKQVPEMFRGLFRAARIGNIGWRSLWPMWIAGKRLLRQHQYDLVYFSTAQFPLFLLGRLWRNQFGVPYLLDIHDPIFKEDARRPVWMRSRLKHSVSRAISRFLESYAVNAATGLVAVSPSYIEDLRRRHGVAEPSWVRPGRAAVIPFSARAGDLLSAAERVTSPLEECESAYRIVYVGVGGAVMMRSFTLFCKVLAEVRRQFPSECQGIRVELFGTMLHWKPGEPRALADIAARFGLDDMIREEPARVSYRRSIELLLRSDGALVFGVEDPGYMPSKLVHYALSGKPPLLSSSVFQA